MLMEIPPLTNRNLIKGIKKKFENWRSFMILLIDLLIYYFI
jgi:hypothetical protein